jgi:putative phage-type endonuclease
MTEIPWIREKSLYIFTGEQRSEDWFIARKNRLTGSNVAGAIGRSDFKTPKETADQITGKVKVEINESMLRGMKYEDKVRNWYEQEFNVKVKEMGFAFKKKWPYWGVSPDGLVGDDGLIEIKCPDKMYWKLMAVEKSGEAKYNENNVPLHVFSSHYDQMQMQMAILDCKWCDYVVFSLAENMFYVERIDFNKAHWEEMMVKMTKFVDKYLKDLTVYIPDI